MQRREGITHAYRVEDLTGLNRVLGQQYHAVVGNPPYIRVKDRALNQEYRKWFSTCHQKYSLVVPFIERFFDLTIYGYDTQQAGYVGMIATDGFMKRDWGKKLIEEFFSRLDLTHVIHTSGAYIPGLGTPTVILFGRHRPPVGQTVRAVLGICGEPGTPVDPAQGQVWRSIIDLLDSSGAQNDFVSVTDVPRATLAKHPWSIGGGGATELKEILDSVAQSSLGMVTESIGITSFTLEDDVYILPMDTARRLRIVQSDLRSMLVGDAIRDWVIHPSDPAIFPYDTNFSPLPEHSLRETVSIYGSTERALQIIRCLGGKPRLKLAYPLYGLTDQDLCYRDADGNHGESPELTLGQRAFEIVMARHMASGELETTWFERHGSKPITELPKHWPEDYKQLVERRIALIQRDTYINLIERPEYKRRWNTEPWEEQERRALRSWLLDRLEDSRYWQEPSLQTTRTLANQAQMEADFLQVAELYRGHAGFDVHALVAELVEAESVPFLPVLRYKPSGLRKREIWERTWELQRREDAVDAEVAATLTHQAEETTEQFQARLAAEQRRRKREDIGDIPPPPKYTSADFQSSTCWRLRGALDVPKERFISYPCCSREADPSLLIGWAGWDHLQQARALAAYYTEVVEQEGWSIERLKPLLAGLAELIPWLKQWHNDLDSEYHERMGDFFETFLQGQLQTHGLTHDDLRHWTPPAVGRPRRGRLRS